MDIKLLNRITSMLIQEPEFPKAESALISVIHNKPVSDSDALELIRFSRDYLRISDTHEIIDYFAEVHDINYSVWEI